MSNLIHRARDAKALEDIQEAYERGQVDSYLVDISDVERSIAQ